MTPPLHTLAQAANSSAVAHTLLWLAAILVIVIGTGLAVLAFRKRVLAKGGDADEHQSLMDTLRGMRDRGEISAEEFEATRRSMVHRLKESIDARPPAKNTNTTVRKSLHTGRPQSRPQGTQNKPPPAKNEGGAGGTPGPGRTP